MTNRYTFAFDPRFRGPLALLGIRPDRSVVEITDDRFVARFGPWLVDTPVDNVKDVSVTGPHNPLRAIGPRFSPTSRSLTFGSNAGRTVRVEFRDPVPGLDPFGVVKHPALSVSVADPLALETRLKEAMTASSGPGDHGG